MGGVRRKHGKHLANFRVLSWLTLSAGSEPSITHSERRGWRRGGQLFHAHHCDDKIEPRSLWQIGHGGREAIAGAYSGRTPAPRKLSESMTPQQ